jgi:Mn2+/Fe2+ NRAMP family transporter
VLNGILLPVVMVCMILLINDKNIMGKHTNKPLNNFIGWTAVAILVCLSLSLLVLPFFKR